LEVQVGALIAALSLLVSYLAFSLNKQKETKSESRQDAKIQAQLDYIGKGVDDIRIDLKANERQIGALGERVTRVEESNKSLHKRLDNIDKKGDA
jgi:septal ring factor EnvC (AmiA/AmiB activator)